MYIFYHSNVLLSEYTLGLFCDLTSGAFRSLTFQTAVISEGMEVLEDCDNSS